MTTTTARLGRQFTQKEAVENSHDSNGERPAMTYRRNDKYSGMSWIVLAGLVLVGGSDPFGLKRTAAQGPDWNRIKAQAAPFVGLPDEFGTPYRQPLAVGGWEDGVYITRDGLNLYCIYLPVDMFSFVFEQHGDITDFEAFRRGPTFGMDLKTNPAGAKMWLHGDILYAKRKRLTEPFSSWRLSNLARPVWSEGGVCVVTKGSRADCLVYTSNHRLPSDNDNVDLMMLRNCPLNPRGPGKVLPPPVTTSHIEDNPHIERLGPKELVLFFDSNRPGGRGGLDMWFTTSRDDGATWAKPTPVTGLNSRDDEQMPHLFRDESGMWWLYFMGVDPQTGRSAIYRCRRRSGSSWDKWSKPQLVIGTGNTFAVGEPTLTKYGDISFVVVYRADDGTRTDRYDCDPWLLPRKGSPLHHSRSGRSNSNSATKPRR